MAVRLIDQVLNSLSMSFKGVPLRIAIGPKDLKNGTVEVARRDNLTKTVMNISDLETNIVKLLETIQNDIYNKALDFRDNHITKVDDFKSFKKVLEEKGGLFPHIGTENLKQNKK